MIVAEIVHKDGVDAKFDTYTERAMFFVENYGVYECCSPTTEIGVCVGWKISFKDGCYIAERNNDIELVSKDKAEIENFLLKNVFGEDVC